MVETFFTHTSHNDAARRVATSSEERENRFKPPYSKRESAAKDPYGVNLLGGFFPFPVFKQISIKQFHFSKSVATRRAAS